MKSYFRIGLLLLSAVLITVFLASVVASILPFHLYKVMSRTVLIVSFFLFWHFREKLGFKSIKSLGFSLDRRWWIQLGTGFGLAAVSMGIIAAVMLRTSIRFITPDLSFMFWTRHLGGYLLAGFIVALVEECFFRGFILQSLLRDTPLFICLVAVGIFYSVVHFLRPPVLPQIVVLNITSSIRSIPLFFKPLIAEWFSIWPSLLGLFLVGLVLSMAYLRTRSLALPLGLHAGWIVGIKSLSLGTDVTSTGNLWVNGVVIGHPLSWGVLVVLLAILSWGSLRHPSPGLKP